MAKKKKSKKQSGLKANKTGLTKKSVSKSPISKKSVKPKKTAKTKAKKKKAQQILSKQSWRSTKTATGKLKKGRKRSLKLQRQGEQSRYQQIVKAISDYYKKAGTPLKRADLYKEYRRIRDNYSNIPLAVLLPRYNTLVVQQKGKRVFPNELQLGIPWYQFEDEMTAPYSQRYFLSKDSITLDLSCLQPMVPDMTFPYIKVIGNYKKLYNNITFRTQVKAIKSPVPEFLIDWSKSNVSKGIYVFVLVDCPPITGVQPAPKPTALPPGAIPQYPTPGIPGAMPSISASIIEKEISSKLDEKINANTAYKNKEISYREYQDIINKLDKEIDNLKSTI